MKYRVMLRSEWESLETELRDATESREIIGPIRVEFPEDKMVCVTWPTTYWIVQWKQRIQDDRIRMDVYERAVALATELGYSNIRGGWYGQ